MKRLTFTALIALNRRTVVSVALRDYKPKVSSLVCHFDGVRMSADVAPSPLKLV